MPIESPRRSRRTLLGAAVAVLLATLAVVVPGTPVHAANLEQHSPATYNMQGSNSDTTPKWSNDIVQLTIQHDVLALQEAGPVPAQDPNGLFAYQGSFSSGPLTVYHYLRNFGTSSRPIVRHVYFMETDPNGHRVNLAMVTAAEPDTVWFTVATGGRPNFGVQFGQTVFFTIHALSGGGTDAQAAVAAIANGVRGAGLDYAIMGDFNRNPNTLAGLLPNGAHIYRSGDPTQQSGGELDYMVASRDLGAAGVFYEGHVLGGIGSDHFPVEFGAVPLQAAAAPYKIGSYSNYTDQERILDVFQNDSSNGTHIVTWEQNGGLNQVFTFQPTADGNYTIRSGSTGKCLDLNNGPNATAGDYVNEWDCLGQATQEWWVGYWPSDPGALAIVNTTKNLCLDEFKNGTGNGVWADAYTCTGADNQKWTLQFQGTSLYPSAFGPAGSAHIEAVRPAPVSG
jgi:hypothetical protein